MIPDNLVTDIYRASRCDDMTPVFGRNSEGSWQGTGTSSAVDPLAWRFGWRKVLRKAFTEGSL